MLRSFKRGEKGGEVGRFVVHGRTLSEMGLGEQVKAKPVCEWGVSLAGARRNESEPIKKKESGKTQWWRTVMKEFSPAATYRR